ncbi:protein SAWADEE HOMEODOMAIN HOMOLOG 1-like [Apium graveolens]|uniref:protein SAWADEE HOMEODOMAIN HOMOLOG 1-like n=1 Tax=Apium graveolens TaxID=4045 RepID=UPI003D7BB1DF
MDRLRHRHRQVFSGFTKSEIERMEKLLKESGEETMDIAFCKKLTRSFNSSKGRAGKPALKWTEVQNWFLNPQVASPPKENSVGGSNKSLDILPVDKPNESTPTSEGEKDSNSSKLEFEAKSLKDGAWYDVDEFKDCRSNSISGEMEALVRFIGFGSDEDEWVNVKECVRERSLGLEHSECHTLKVGDLVLCFQERRDLAKYYDAHIIDIKRKLHDIRGCRCTFSVRYDHNNVEEKIGLSRLCRILKPQANITDEVHS